MFLILFHFTLSSFKIRSVNYLEYILTLNYRTSASHSECVKGKSDVARSVAHKLGARFFHTKSLITFALNFQWWSLFVVQLSALPVSINCFPTILFGLSKDGFELLGWGINRSANSPLTSDFLGNSNGLLLGRMHYCLFEKMQVNFCPKWTNLFCMRILPVHTYHLPHKRVLHIHVHNFMYVFIVVVF